jgi:hypothetical protein
MLETAATLTREMKPYDMMSSFRGANALLQGQQNKGRTGPTNCKKKIEETVAV